MPPCLKFNICHSYPACKAHATNYIIICGQSGCSTFFRIISQTLLFSGEKKLLNIKCVFIFSTNSRSKNN